jgi:hypothetical protein
VRSVTKGGGVFISALKGPGDLGVNMGVLDGEVVTLLSLVRPCKRGVPPRGPWTCIEVRT